MESNDENRLGIHKDIETDTETEMNLEYGKDKGSVDSKGEEGHTEVSSIKESFKKILQKKKLRLDLGLGLGVTQSAPSSPSENVSTIDLTWDEEQARSFKRRREDTGETKVDEVQEGNAKLATTIRRIIKRIDVESRTIAQLARERNTKRELKEAASNLRSMVSEIMTTKSQELLQTLGRGQAGESIVEPEIADNSTQTDPPKGERTQAHKETEQLSTERNVKDKGENLKDQKVRLLQEIKKLKKENQTLRERITSLTGQDMTKHITEEEIAETNTYEKFQKTRNRTWPEGVFHTAFIATGNPLRANRESDLLVIGESDMDMSLPGLTKPDKGEPITSAGIRRAFVDRYPELNEADGKMTTITYTTKMESGGEMVQKERWITKAEIDDDEQDWFETLARLKEKMVKGKRNKLAIYPPTADGDGEKTRKMLECLYRDTGIKCLVYIEGEGKSKKKKNKASDTEVMIVKEEGKSYSQLLKMVKEEIDPRSAAARGIKTIREAREGGLLIVLDRKEEGAITELKRSIKSKDTLRVKTSRGRQKGTVYVKDIDGVTTKEEVVENICKELEIVQDECTISDLRPYAGGNQAVTVTLEKAKAQKLVKAGKIRIGLSWCPITERVEVDQCYRCWQYGHKKDSWREKKDYGKACRKCGEEGHMAADCQKEAICFNCKVPGHTAGSGRCPEFRKALSRARLNNKKRKFIK